MARRPYSAAPRQLTRAARRGARGGASRRAAAAARKSTQPRLARRGARAAPVQPGAPRRVLRPHACTAPPPSPLPATPAAPPPSTPPFPPTPHTPVHPPAAPRAPRRRAPRPAPRAPRPAPARRRHDAARAAAARRRAAVPRAAPPALVRRPPRRGRRAARAGARAGRAAPAAAGARRHRRGAAAAHVPPVRHPLRARPALLPARPGGRQPAARAAPARAGHAARHRPLCRPAVAPRARCAPLHRRRRRRRARAAALRPRAAHAARRRRQRHAAVAAAAVAHAAAPRVPPPQAPRGPPLPRLHHALRQLCAPHRHRQRRQPHQGVVRPHRLPAAHAARPRQQSRRAGHPPLQAAAHLRQQRHHAAREVNAVQCSPCPDRPYLVSGGADGSVRLWNADHFEAGHIRIPTPTRPPSRSAADSQRNARAVATSATAPPSPLPGSAQPPSAAVSAAAVSVPVAALPQSSAAGASSPPLAAPAEPPRNGAAHSMVSGTPTYEVLSVCFNAGATRLAVSGTDCAAHIYAIDKPQTEESVLPRVRLLTSLRGHSELISQVLFSRNGSTIVTACRDGTARIWNRTKARLPPARGRAASVEGMGSWSYKVLDCRSQIQADAPSMLSGAASGSACGSIVPRMRRPVFPVSVCAVLWSHDDRYVFTATSDAKIRVWYADTAELARVLHAHEGEIYVMDCHPLNGRILLSGGYDGQVSLWDVETGAKLRSFSIAEQIVPEPSNGGLPVPVKAPKIIDGQFSADGLSFVTADTSGAINLFGIDSGEATALAPEEQFFASDCTPFRRDAQQRAVDENTGVLLHLAPRGRLCDKELRPHPPELQPNAPQMGLQLGNVRDKAENTAQQPSVTFKSTSYARDPNCDALLKRAKEFRENQEKEEKRLLREARNTRRRMIMERERVALEKADGVVGVPLRDFEAPDSEYEDSDEDFDGDAYLSDDSDSSSSSDEDDDDDDADERMHDGEENEEELEIRPVRRKRRRTSTNESRNESSERVRPQSRRTMRKRRASSQGGRKDVLHSPKDGDLMGSKRCGFEVFSNVGHTGDSNLNDEQGPVVHVTGETEKPEGRPAFRERPEGDEELKSSPQNGDSHSLRGALSNLSSAPVLIGASAQNRKRRMRICTGSTPSQARLGGSGDGHRLRAIDYAAESHTGALRQERTHVRGSQSVGSCYGRVNQTEAGGNVVSQVPLNPSFTSERVDKTGANEAVFKPIEDHQGDSASCFRPRPSIPHPDSRSRTFPHEQMQNRSFVEGSPHCDIKDPEVRNANKTEGNDKSVLSDFPARLTRRQRRERTRNGVSNGDPIEKFDHVVDIDEVAQRELEILEAQRNDRYHKKRRRRQSSENGDECYSSGDPDKRYNKRMDPRRASGLRMRPTRRNSKSEDLMLCKERVAGAPENGIKSLEASTWLRSTSTPYTYVPQLGDDVMYFPGGHLKAMEVSRSSGLDPLLDKAEFKKKGLEVLDGNLFAKDEVPLHFHVVDLQFDFPTLLAPKGRNVGSRRGGKRQPDGSVVKPKTKVILTLQLLSPPRRRSGQSAAFVLSYFPVDVPEYLVLTSRVNAALSRTWKPSDRFRILFLNEKRAWQYYTGKVRSVKSTLRTTMWNSIEVEYDNESGREKENVDLVSPWELEPLDLLEGSKSVHHHYGSAFKASTVEPGLFPAIARELEGMKQSESDWRAQLLWLETTISLASAPDYCVTIPCPMDLNTVLVRLCTGYYRHYSAFCFDLMLLKNNAVRYHGSKSEAGRLADTAFTRIIDLADKVRAQFSFSWIPFQAGHGAQMGTTIGGQSTYRFVYPRPSHIELSAVNGIPSAHTPAVPTTRHGPVPVSQRESVSGVTTPVLHHPENASPTMLGQPSQRAWNTMLRFGASQVPNPFHQSHPMSGAGLPPALPGMPLQGASIRTAGRGPRATTRGQGVRQGATSGRRTVGSVHMGGGQGSSASVVATAGTLPVIGGTPPTGIALITPQGSPRVQPANARMVTNSTQSNLTQRHQMRLPMPNGPLPSPTVTRPGASNSFPIPPSLEGLLDTASKTGGNAGPSLPEHLVHHGGGVRTGTSHTNLRSPLALQSRATRAGSTAGEGGANSWARSMEGAGGMFHHQASTSDSHLPVPTHGRSQSPISPIPIGTDASHRTRGQHNQFASANTGARYQEYSTLSMAAAESTMSCGGAEVAQHAATAESAEITPVSRPRRTTS
ncbi:Bromodomain containing protein [Gracilaria domingensis]|nr:Bromodomain containing protein [Gracilaria domingensis]